MSALRDSITTEYNRLFNYALVMINHRQQAEDLLSEAVILMLEFEDRYIDQGTFIAWAMCIIRNCRNDKSRHIKRHQRYEEECKVNPEFMRPPQDNDLFMRDIDRALAKLWPPYQAIVIDVMIKGFSYREVADARGVTVGTVKSRLWRAREALTKAYYGVATVTPAQKMAELPPPEPIIIRPPKPIAMKRPRGRPINSFSAAQQEIRSSAEIDRLRVQGKKFPGCIPRKVMLVPGKLRYIAQ